MTDKFCPNCGTALISKYVAGRERGVCSACNHVRFGRFSLAAGGLLVHEGRVLLVQRGEEPGRGRWTLPGGYVEEDETPDLAAAREVFEETGLRVRATNLLAVRHTLREADQNSYYVFETVLEGPAEIKVDGIETVQAGFFALDEFDSVGDVAGLSRWIAERYATGSGLRRVLNADQLKPLSGHQWSLFGVTDC